LKIEALFDKLSRNNTDNLKANGTDAVVGQRCGLNNPIDLLTG